MYGGGRTKIFKKSQKSRFFKSFRTLITNQVSGKTQLSKVVALLKRLGHRLHAGCENRNILPFFGRTRTRYPKALWGPPYGVRHQKSAKIAIFSKFVIL